MCSHKVSMFLSLLQAYAVFAGVCFIMGYRLKDSDLFFLQIIV